MQTETVESGKREGARPGVSLDGLFAAAGWLALSLGLVSVVGRRVWPIELVTHFWPQLAVTLICSGCVAVFSRAWTRSVVHGAGALVLVVLIAPIFALGRSSEAATSELVAMFANVERANTEFDLLVETIRTEAPDIVALAEVDDGWLEALEVVRHDYPYQLSFPRDDNFGIALLSRVPLSEGTVEFVGPARLPSIFATLEGDAGPWRIVVTHPLPPFNAFAFDRRNEQLAALSNRLAGVDTHVVLLGDLNATLWSPYLTEFLENSGLESASSGLRALYTWPAGMPLLALGLDHCLYSPSAQSVDFRVLNSVGSDHFPILCAIGGS